jgi:hypothetical protein
MALLTRMDHQEALRQMAVEKYLLNELPPAVRDEFEEHYFGCQECAADLRATSAFLNAMKSQPRGASVARLAASSSKPPWRAWFLRPAFLSPAFAFLLLIIVYQNLILYPRLSGDSAAFKNPEILPALSLVGGNSRGGAAASLMVADGQPILVSVDVPTQDQYSSYEFTLVSPSGAAIWHLPVSAEQAKETVAVRIPTAHWPAGEYRLIVYGRAPGVAAEKAADLAHYRFLFGTHR